MCIYWLNFAPLKNLMDKPKVSVITVVFNGEKHLEQTILSVLGQSYPDIEYILIDGGSTDGSIGIIKKYAQHIAYWVSEKDQGISDAFNKGLAKATGEIVGMINADDWYEPEAVALAVSHIQGQGVCFGNMQLWKNEQKEFLMVGNLDYLENEMSINHPTVFVRKSCYDQYGLFNVKYRCAMDYDLLLRLKINQVGFVYIPALMANMRWDGLSDTSWKLGCAETLDIKNSYFPGRRRSNRLFYYKHLFAIGIGKFLTRVGLGSIIRFYRNSFSKVRKEYD